MVNAIWINKYWWIIVIAILLILIVLISIKLKETKVCIKFRSNGATDGEMQHKYTSFKDNCMLCKNNYKKENYIFYHWNTSPDDNGEIYNNMQNMKHSISVDDDILVLYAIWKPCVCMVKFNTLGGTFIEAISIVNGEYIYIDSIPLHYDRKFDYWCIDKNCVVFFDQSLPIIDNITLYAKWSPLAQEEFEILPSLIKNENRYENNNICSLLMEDDEIKVQSRSIEICEKNIMNKYDKYEQLSEQQKHRYESVLHNAMSKHGTRMTVNEKYDLIMYGRSQLVKVIISKWNIDCYLVIPNESLKIYASELGSKVKFKPVLISIINDDTLKCVMHFIDYNYDRIESERNTAKMIKRDKRRHENVSN